MSLQDGYMAEMAAKRSDNGSDLLPSMKMNQTST